MSFSLYWQRPPEVPPEPEGLDYALKRILGPRLWGHDGSLKGQPVRVGRELLEYLAGLADAGVEGAQELREAILGHGSVVVWIGDAADAPWGSQGREEGS